MAKSASSPKRKRGRPQNASKATTASLDRPDDYEADVEEARPKKKGRPKKTSQIAQPAAAAAEGDQQQPRRNRGRPSLEKTRADAQNESEGPVPQVRRKRGRPSLEEQIAREGEVEKRSGHQDGPHDSRRRGGQEQQQEEEEEDAPAETLPRRRGRKPANDQSGKQTLQQQKQLGDQPERRPGPDVEGRGGEPGEPDARKKRGRPRKSGDTSQVAEEVDEQELSSRTRNRPSLQDLPHEDAHNKRGKAAASSKRAKRKSNGNADDMQGQDEGQPRKRRRQQTARDASDQEESQTEQIATASKPRGRRRSSQKDVPDAEDMTPSSPPKPYMHVAPQTRHIRPSIIAAKWSPLSGASLPATSTILSLAQQPIIQRTAAARNRRQHAEAALNLVARRVTRKLSRGLPFPPASLTGRDGRPGRLAAGADGGRAAELDFESVLDGRSALERQLGPALHAVELLRRERGRMEKELERDYEKLRDLESRARAQTRARNEQLKKAHVLAPTSRPRPQEAHDRSVITAGETSNVFKDLDHPELEPLAVQLSGHVDSIQSNLQQGSGISEQLGRSRAALQGVLMRYLNQESYERVVLG
ncbi:CENP-Q, a CENPA-CAD centromere complex subunit-domain-containing protein [Mariannaea sp. PMI_226]|nr:CENP-Q, a CENPA-CAD centromere complex subunit-domain-containing protein [Mariannaea sp. PMI_226]